MGFIRVVPENSKAQWVTPTTFVAGGALVFLLTLGGLLVAALNVIPFVWQQTTRAIIGVALMVVGFVISLVDNPPKSH
jgi:hypothetical protein